MKSSILNKSLAGLIIFFPILFSGCAYSRLQGYEQAASVAEFAPASWFDTKKDHLLMTTSMDVMKRHFSGLMVVKPVNEDGYRVIFMSEIGLKIFDLEFNPGEPVKVYYFMDAMNRRVLVQTLESDLSLALMLPNPGEKIRYYRSEPGKLMIMLKKGNKKNYYGLSGTSNKPEFGVQKAGLSKKVRVDYYSHDDFTLDSVKISHYHIRMLISLKSVNEN